MNIGKKLISLLIIIMEINYGSTYYEKIILNKNIIYSLPKEITINYETNELFINAKLPVGKYYIDTLVITVKPTLFYNLNNPKKFIPIIYPPIYDNTTFDLDINNPLINIDKNTGIIYINDLDIGFYSFHVICTMNYVETNYFISFTIDPIFYYKNNNTIINYGELAFSEKPITNISTYKIICDYKISSDGILDFYNYDVGYYDISITININNINYTTHYFLSVLPILSYDNIICNAFSNYYSDKPIVSQIGGEFKINNNNFIIDKKTGIIFINSPTNIYQPQIEYFINGVSTKFIITITINPIITYNTQTIKCDNIYYSNDPISNEEIDGIFEIINFSNFNISNSGVIEFNYLYPDNYKIDIKYTKNNCYTITTLLLTVLPVLNIIDNTFIIYPKNSQYTITCNNPNVIINNYNFNLSNIKTIGNNIIIFTININNQLSFLEYNHIIKPVINYPKKKYYCDYNSVFISDKFIEYNSIYKNNLTVFIDDNIINNIIDEFGEITLLTDNFNVGKYYIKVILSYNDFIVNTDFELIIKPIIIIPNQNIIYKDYILKNITLLPQDGELIHSLDFSLLDVGTYNCLSRYIINNIESITDFIITIEPLDYILNLSAESKIFDNTTDVIIKALNFDNLIINGHFININVGNNKNIIIDDIINNNNNNYNFKYKQIKANIYPKTINPVISCYDKVFDNTLNAHVEIKINNLPFYNFKAQFTNKNVGYNKQVIINIDNFSDDNYKLESFIYYSNANITKKDYNITLNIPDKFYDNTNNINIESYYTTYFIIYFKNIIFANSNIGYHEIIINDYTIEGGDNYNIIFNKTYANILPLFVNLIISNTTKIYDGTNIAYLNFDYDIVSYKALYNDKNIGSKKIITITDIIFKNCNYITNDYIIFGEILPKNITFEFIGNDKMYDGTTKCDGDYKINIIENDSVECIFNAEFKNINNNSNIELIINNLQLIGPDSKNYNIILITTNTPSIYKKELFINFKSLDKMYDKTTTAFIDIIDYNGLIDNNIPVQIISLNANYDDHIVGNNKIIYITDIVLTPQLFNYFVNNTKIIGNILLREITLNITNTTKTYDGRPNINVTISDINNIIDDDLVYVESLESKFISDNIINITNIKLSGIPYYICNNFKIEGNILPKIINIDFIAEPIEYETKIPKLNYDHNIVKSFYAEYVNLNVGEQDIIIKDIVLYDKYLSCENLVIKGIILPKNIDLQFINLNKIFDETNKTYIKCVNNDIVSFDSKYLDINVGKRKIIITNIISNNNNYIYKTEIELIGEIYQKELIINLIIDLDYNDLNYYNYSDTIIKSAECIFIDNTNILVKNIILYDTNYYIQDFYTKGQLKPKIIKPEFIVNDKIYDNTDKVYFKFIPNDIISFDAKYYNYNIGLQKIIINNIKFKNDNYKAKDIILESTIKPKTVNIDFTIKPKIYDKTINVINDDLLYTINDNIKITFYNAEYKTPDIGIHDVYIKNIIFDNPNYITNNYIIKGEITKRKIILTFDNIEKEFDNTINSNIKIKSIENILNDDNINITYYKAFYINERISNNVDIIVKDILFNGSDNYYISDYKIKGVIKKITLECEFKLVNNVIKGKIIGLLNNDNIWISNYISYKRNNIIYIDNILLKGSNIDNYILNNKKYQI